MNGIRRALVLATAERYANLAISFVTLAVVSRLLTPAEIGVSVVGLAVTNLILSAREFATTNYIIQHRTLEPEVVRLTFTILMAVSVLISASLAALSGSLAELYGEPRLQPYLVIMAIGIVVEAVGAVVSALLRREMAFGKLAIISVAGAAVNSCTVIVLVLLGFSYMSFAWASLASACVISLLALCFWPDKSIFKPCLNAWREMMTFGGYNGLNVSLFRVYEALPSIVLGRILSFENLALYSRAVTICQLPDRAILRGLDMILLPAFSVEVRNGRGLAAAYLRSVEIITVALWPALTLLAILADPVVRLLLGDQWLGSVPLVRIMAIASLFSFSAELNYPVLVALGAMRDILKRSLIAWPISAAVISAAAFLGLEAAALAWLITLPFQAYVSVYFVKRHVRVRWSSIGRALMASAAVTVCSSLGALLVVAVSGGFRLTYAATALAAVLSAIGWVFGLWVTAHPLFAELQRTMTGLMALASPRSRPRPNALTIASGRTAREPKNAPID